MVKMGRTVTLHEVKETRTKIHATLDWDFIMGEIESLPVEKVSREEYREIISEAKAILEGKTKGMTIEEVKAYLRD